MCIAIQLIWPCSLLAIRIQDQSPVGFRAFLGFRVSLGFSAVISSRFLGLIWLIWLLNKATSEITWGGTVVFFF